MLGPPGLGKTHLVVALAKKAIERGYGACFVRAYDLMEGLRKARNEQPPLCHRGLHYSVELASERPITPPPRI